MVFSDPHDVADDSDSGSDGAGTQGRTQQAQVQPQVPDDAGKDFDFGDGVEGATDDGPALAAVPDVSCQECSHYPVCAMRSSVNGITAEWPAGGPDTTAPVDPDDFAKICREFEPARDGGGDADGNGDAGAAAAPTANGGGGDR